MKHYRPLGMDNEGKIYALEIDENTKKPVWNSLGYSTSCAVIRPVSEGLLEAYKTDIDYYRDDWKEAVRADLTEDSLEDFAKSQLAECDGDEEFPWKDDSFVDDIIGDDTMLVARDTADADAEDITGEPVGTWESAGWFGPQEPFAKVYAPKQLVEEYYKHLETHHDNCNHFAR